MLVKCEAIEFGAGENGHHTFFLKKIEDELSECDSEFMRLKQRFDPDFLKDPMYYM